MNCNLQTSKKFVGKKLFELFSTVYENGYGGKIPALKMGALLALNPSTDTSYITHPKVRKIADAMRDYGAYVVDNTAWDVHAYDFDIKLLQIVSNFTDKRTTHHTIHNAVIITH